MKVLSLSLTLGSIRENLKGASLGVFLGIQRMRATKQGGDDVTACVCPQGWLERDLEARLEPAFQGTWSYQGARGREGRGEG